MMSLAIFFSYGLQFYVPIELMLPTLKSRISENLHLPAEFVLRYSVVLFTCKCGSNKNVVDRMFSCYIMFAVYVGVSDCVIFIFSCTGRSHSKARFIYKLSGFYKLFYSSINGTTNNS